MSEVVLRTVGLGKRYRIGREREQYRTLRDVIVRTAKRPIERIRHPGAATHASEDLWALRNLDLEVRSGDVLGVIGGNGAGKSTLLKILSRITEPTEGRVEMKGRVGSLLEVGTGFHAELTGRENIYLNGAILGMGRNEIKRKFDEIVEFSEMGRFLDTPVKRYSSGMYVRLAFAVAAHMDPEILLVDEVLAVGDAQFQRKCIGKMGDVAKGGRTVLFVSHNMNVVLNLCSSALLLEQGTNVMRGDVREVVSRYLHTAVGQGGVARIGEDHAGRWFGSTPLIRTVALRADARPEDTSGLVTAGEAVSIEVLCAGASTPLDYCLVGICDPRGERLFSLSTSHDPTFEGEVSGSGRFVCHLPSLDLGDSDYSLIVAVGTAEPRRHLDVVEGALRFRVDFQDYFGSGSRIHPGQGLVARRSSWEVEDSLEVAGD